MFSKQINIGQKDEWIVLQWEKGFRNVKVIFNGREIGGFDNREELFGGKSFTLYGDESLFIGFSVKHTSFIIKRNGAYVKNSPYHPQHHMSPLIWTGLALGAIYFICGLVCAAEYFVDRHGYFNGNAFGIYYGCISFTGLLFMIIPSVLKKGYYYWLYVGLALVFIFITWHACVLYMTGMDRSEDILVMFFVNLPAMVMGILLFAYRKLSWQLMNERSLKNNFSKVIS